MTKKIVYKPLSLKLPEEWHQKLNTLATEKDKSMTELMIQIVANYLGYSSQETADLQDINLEKLEEEYQELSERVAVLEAKDNQLEKLENRLMIMEKLMDSIQHQVTVRDYAGKLPPHLVSDSDDFEDEPDEILTSFLD